MQAGSEKNLSAIQEAQGQPRLGRSPGQRSLAGYSTWGRKESDTTEQLTISLSGSEENTSGLALWFMEETLLAQEKCWHKDWRTAHRS